MNIFNSIVYIIGAMLIALGAFLIHMDKSVGAGLLCFGIILIGIVTGFINFTK